MEEVKKKKQTSFMKNVLMLMVAQVAIKILGFLYRLVIINIEGFGDTGNGYYSTGYQIYSLLLTLSSVGIPTVISKLVSERVAIGDHKGAHKIFKTALKTFTTIGIVMSLGLFFGADFIAKNVINVEGVKYTLMVLAPAIMFVAAGAVLRGYFAGLGTMKPTSVTQTLEQFLNCVLTILFVYSTIGKDTAIMAAAGNLSSTIAIIIAFIYIIIFYKKQKPEILEDCKNQTVQMETKTTKQILKIIFAVSIPMTIGSLVAELNGTIDTLTVSNCIQKAFQGALEGGKDALEAKAMQLSGMVSKIETIIRLPLAINAAFCTALVPAIAASLAKKDKETAIKRLSFSFFLSIIIIAPCAVGLMTLAEPILKTIYPNSYEGATILQITSISMIFVALSYVINGGLYGLGKTHIPAIALAIGAGVKTILNIILVSNPKINILGSPISSTVCQGINFIICSWYLSKYIKLDIKFSKHIFKPLFSAGTMGIAAYLIHKTLINVIGNSKATIIAIFVGIITYAIMIIANKTLNKEDMYMIPFGTKLYKLLTKLGIYKEEKV
jgi:stage V sporulation protein B